MKRKIRLLTKVKSIAGLVSFGLATCVAVAAYARSTSAAFYPIVDPRTGYLLGGSQNGKWLDDTKIASKIKGGEHYQVWKSSSMLGNTTGGKVLTNEPPCMETYWVNLQRNYNGEIALGANWNAAPRRVKVQDVNQRVYRDAVAAILRANKIRNPVVKIKQIWRVDLDGNGTQEVLIAASNYKYAGQGHVSPSATGGEYSLVLLRQIVNGKVKTTLLTSEFYPKSLTFNAPSEHTLAGVYDLNGDGKMEVVIRSRYYEGNSIQVYEVKNGVATGVLGSGCGA